MDSYTNWNPPNEPDKRADFGCIAESNQGKWWTTNCDRKYDMVVCSYDPCPGGLTWVGGRCLWAEKYEEAEGKTFDEANAACGFTHNDGTNLIVDNQAISDFIKTSNLETPIESHWIGAQMVGLYNFLS